ncbi:hypothetical protein DAPPUDRAFT_275286 [Daphnia pulex]|uniref:Crp/Fnr family transcriptional regulator n=1 Tax=Daphnia pulex TaxID=6669 RepID=E9I5B9_DAPPU|nr:hypothetical protein DAPPUDRAFT_275286 [Daphnia pulex]|eukprot:EFX60812.1 hypothetical protein DAPPUDRAFT_275286 [Daphnia pulex]
MNPDSLQALLAASVIRSHAAGQLLSRRGTPLGELIFVLQGSLEASMAGADGRRSICWYLAEGQWFGLIPIVDGQAAIHDLRTYSQAVLLHIPRAAFLAALQQDRGLAVKCLELLCARSRTLYEHLAAETLLPLRARVARLLLMLVEQHGRESAHGQELSLKLSQEALADMLGISRQTLNRELVALEKAGLISLAYTRLTLLDDAALRQMIQAPE